MNADTRCELECDHEKLIFTRPSKEQLSLHLQLLGLAHNVNLSSEGTNQIAENMNCDIRKAFHCLHAWCSWSPSNKPVLPSNHMPSCNESLLRHPPSVPWRVDTQPHTSQTHTTHSSLDSQSTLSDSLSDMDILTIPLEEKPYYWWDVIPCPSLLDESSLAVPSPANDLRADIINELQYSIGHTRPPVQDKTLVGATTK